MLAIQSQISVLSKILATKIQQQQILEHQQVLSATLPKTCVQSSIKSRKISSSVDSLSQSVGGKEKLGSLSSNTTNHKLEILNNTMANQHNDNIQNSTNDHNNTKESTGCIIS